jgi:uncharacterized protein (TIGR00369 family)
MTPIQVESMTKNTRARLALDAEGVTKLIDEQFPQLHATGRLIHVVDVAPRRARVRMIAAPQVIRPGGTISGPAMFTLADFSIYVAILAELGAAAVPAATASLNINFLTRPEAKDMLAEVKILRMGRRLVVGEVELNSEESGEIVAHAVGTYALPRTG